MATVVFTMRDGTTRTAEGTTLTQANAAWWHWAQFQERDRATVTLLGEGSDIREVVQVTAQADDAEWSALGQHEELYRARLGAK